MANNTKGNSRSAGSNRDNGELSWEDPANDRSYTVPTKVEAAKPLRQVRFADKDSLWTDPDNDKLFKGKTNPETANVPKVRPQGTVADQEPKWTNKENDKPTKVQTKSEAEKESKPRPQPTLANQGQQSPGKDDDKPSKNQTQPAAIRDPRRRNNVNYDALEEGIKGSLNIPGIYRGSEKVVKDTADETKTRVVRDRAVLGGLSKRMEGYETLKDDKGVFDGLVRTFKTQSNPLRTRTVSYEDVEKSGDTVTAGKRNLDVRYLGTNVGFKFNETDKGRQFTQVRAVAYSMDVKENENFFKNEKGIQQKETNLLGIVKRRYDLIDGNQVETGRKVLGYSKFTDQISEAAAQTSVKRFSGLVSKTYEKPLDAEKGDNSDRFTTERRIGSYRMTARQVTADTAGVKEQKLGQSGALFTRTETIPSQGAEKTVNYKVLGISLARTVKMTEQELADRNKQVNPADAGKNSATGRASSWIRDGANYVSNQFNAFKDSVGKAVNNVESKPLRTAAGAIEVAALAAPPTVRLAAKAGAVALNKISDYNNRNSAEAQPAATAVGQTNRREANGERSTNPTRANANQTAKPVTAEQAERPTAANPFKRAGDFVTNQVGAIKNQVEEGKNYVQTKPLRAAANALDVAAMVAPGPAAFAAKAGAAALYKRSDYNLRNSAENGAAAETAAGQNKRPAPNTPADWLNSGSQATLKTPPGSKQQNGKAAPENNARTSPINWERTGEFLNSAKATVTQTFDSLREKAASLQKSLRPQERNDPQAATTAATSPAANARKPQLERSQSIVFDTSGDYRGATLSPDAVSPGKWNPQRETSRSEGPVDRTQYRDRLPPNPVSPNPAGWNPSRGLERSDSSSHLFKEPIRPEHVDWSKFESKQDRGLDQRLNARVR